MMVASKLRLGVVGMAFAAHGIACGSGNDSQAAGASAGAGGASSATATTGSAASGGAPTGAGGMAGGGTGGATNGGLLQFGDLQYVGAFRVPPSTTGTDAIEYGGEALGFKPGNPGSLFISCQPTTVTVAEINIPAVVDSTDVTTLNTASLLQPCSDPAAGGTVSVGSGSTKIGGMLVEGGKLITSIYLYYDASGSQTAAFFVKPNTNLAQANAVGAYTVTDPAGGAGFVDGWMAPIPAAWQSALKGPFALGNCCIPIISRTSWGPAAFSWNPEQLVDVGTPVPATALLYYTQDHPTLGQWDDATPVDDKTVYWEASGSGYHSGGVIPEGHRSILFFGSQGTGPFCYGCGTAQQPLPPPDASCPEYCYDPVSSSKGNHGYPYRYQVMAYDLADLAAVAAGTKAPYSILPYAVWDLTSSSILGFDGQSNVTAGGAVYDPMSKRIYFAAPMTDGTLPLIHVWQVAP